jgi:hypothetical protein
MASIKISSSLSLAEQAIILHSFVSRQGASLSSDEASKLCESLKLDKGNMAKQLARDLKQALLERSIAVTYSAALEAISQLCGLASWMRVKQSMLKLKPADDSMVYAVQVLANEEMLNEPFCVVSLADVAEFVLKTIASVVPNQVVAGYCRVGRSRKALTIELEVEGPTWLTFHVFAMQPTDGRYELAELPSEAVIEFGHRLERTLEYHHEGLLVVGTVFNPSLPHWFHLNLRARHEREGTVMTIESEIEFFMALDGVQVQRDQDIDAAKLRVEGRQDALSFEASWQSGEDDDVAQSPVPQMLFTRLAQRYLRLKRVTGLTFDKFMLRVMTGEDKVGNLCRIDRDELDRQREQAGLSLADLAQAANLTVPSLLRLKQYGCLYQHRVPDLARALKVADPNVLLEEDDEERFAFRIQDGPTLLRAIKDTDWWATVISDNIPEDARDAASAIAESIRELVDLLQFSQGPSALPHDFDEPPINDDSISADLQECIDDLAAMGIAVLVSKTSRFLPGNPGLGHQHLPMQRTDLCLEQIEHLKPRPVVHPRGKPPEPMQDAA